MANTKQLAELFHAVAEHDVRGAAEVARSIAQAESDRGNHGAARDLFRSLNGYATKTSHATPQPIAQSASVHQLVTALRKEVALEDLELPPALRAEIKALVSEWHHGAALKNVGIDRRWRLLLHGPPGCGKSAIASSLAKLVGIPIYLVRFDSLIGSYLGQTALRLRDVFRFASESPCVLLFDEVDALAKRRGTPMEVGELDRVVIAFMQELEYSIPSGFIVATSNLAHALDEALWRRFDLALHVPKPTLRALRSFAVKASQRYGLASSKALIGKALKTASYADAEQLVLNEARRRALVNLA